MCFLYHGYAGLAFLFLFLFGTCIFYISLHWELWMARLLVFQVFPNCSYVLCHVWISKLSSLRRFLKWAIQDWHCRWLYVLCTYAQSMLINDPTFSFTLIISGTARTSLVITIGPSPRHRGETASTILFGQRVSHDAFCLCSWSLYQAFQKFLWCFKDWADVRYNGDEGGSQGNRFVFYVASLVCPRF